MSFHQDNPDIPLTVSVSKVRSGRTFVFRGTPAGTNRFSVNLLCGSDLYNDKDVALHFDVRFNFEDYRNVVVLSYKSGGVPGTSADVCGFPFSAHSEFEIVIEVGSESYEVSVNGRRFGNLNFGIKPERIANVNVQGDVQLSHVQFFY